ncbi:MAG: choice-of-anchor tandem repeat GloVer-containing protein, partial [Terriglobales bacterium]
MRSTGWMAASALAACVVAILAAESQAQTYQVLYAFKGAPDGSGPAAGVIQDSQGNLYGTTAMGGNSCGANTNGCGTVFKLSTTGNETVLYSFTGGADGGAPSAGLIQDAQGNLYGTTYWGGDISNCSPYGCGVVFKLDPTGNETVLYSFKGSADGEGPQAGLIQDAQGNLYGTTTYGGDPSCVASDGLGCGVVFMLSATGEETVLHTFAGGVDGALPYAGVIQAAQGNLYGTTAYGGAGSCGIVFKLNDTGTETILHTFGCSRNGASPEAGVIQDAAGNLYGTTHWGGYNCHLAQDGCGVVFKLSAEGKETAFSPFSANGGRNPHAGLIEDSSGNFYGTTYAGAYQGQGTVFEMSSTGKRNQLYWFCKDWPQCTDGVDPQAGLIQDAQGNLYGTTTSGGDPSCE